MKLKTGLVIATAVLALPAAALAYTETYGATIICGNNCYVESGAAHTFYVNSGDAIGQSTYLACQLFNHAGTVNKVTHDYGGCLVEYDGGQSVWARVYNQSGTGNSDRVQGQAVTH